MRHHERIKSLISLGVDGGIIGLDSRGMTAPHEERGPSGNAGV